MIVVGCPVKDRAWIMPTWFDHVEAALAAAGEDEAEYVFVGDPVGDNKTAKAIGQAAAKYDRPVQIIMRREEGGPYKRNWNTERLKHMVELRNELLGAVRDCDPDLFWSLDSDILVHEQALTSAISALEQYEAVGMKAYMTKGRECPSYAMLPNLGGLRRDDAEGLMSVDVIMAAKLMTVPAYHVDYAFDARGEDIGWSIAARAAGLRLGWDGRVANKHVMKHPELEVLDERVGF